ncbi:MAG: hypothetical protein KAX81_05695 [Leadbetterella sp.]|nr:hypothetical protein [Leadbetterella sp.]
MLTGIKNSTSASPSDRTSASLSGNTLASLSGHTSTFRLRSMFEFNWLIGEPIIILKQLG